MSASAPVSVAILAFPASSASVIYGMYDLFMSAGRDWGLIVDNAPGPQLMRPMIVAAHPERLTVSNEVAIAAQYTLAHCPATDIVCVSDINIPPGTPLEGLFDDEIGDEDAGFFSRLFRREVNLTPAQYRRRFRGMRNMLESVV